MLTPVRLQSSRARSDLLHRPPPARRGYARPRFRADRQRPDLPPSASTYARLTLKIAGAAAKSTMTESSSPSSGRNRSGAPRPQLIRPVMVVGRKAMLIGTRHDGRHDSCRSLTRKVRTRRGRTRHQGRSEAPHNTLRASMSISGSQRLGVIAELSGRWGYCQHLLAKLESESLPCDGWIPASSESLGVAPRGAGLYASLRSLRSSLRDLRPYWVTIPDA